MGRLQKKGVSIFLAIIFALSNIWAGVPTINAKAAEASEEDGGNENGEETTLGVATNLRWKEGSSATAMWDAVEGANYYEVTVYVSRLNDEFVGSVTTGTSETEIDLQQEIVNVYEGNNLDDASVGVTFTIKACNNDSDGISKSGDESDNSYVLIYVIVPVCNLDIPQNVQLSEDLIVSWDCIEGIDGSDNRDYCVKIKIKGIEREVKHVRNGSDGFSVKNNKCYLDMSDIKNWQIGYECSNNLVDVSVAIMSYSYGEVEADGLVYKSSEFSDYSNVVYIKDDERNYLRSKPENVSLSDDLVASWDVNDEIGKYQVCLVVGDNKVFLMEASENVEGLEINDGRMSIDISEKIELACIRDNLINDELKIAIFVSSNVYRFIDSNVLIFNSDLSNEVNYVCNLETYTFEKIENVSVSDNYVVSWNHVNNYRELSELAISENGYECFSYDIRIFINDKHVVGIFTGFNNFSDEPVWDIGDSLKTYYYLEGYENEIVTIKVDICATGLNKSIGGVVYKAGPYSDSITFKYSPRKNIEQINIAPKKPILYQNNSLYLGKTITPEDAYYDSIGWTSSDSNIVSVDDIGKITGINLGKADVTATIGDISDTVEVTVYDISSNIENEEDREEVTDTAGDIIDDIANNDTPDLENTDISEEDLDDIRDDIQEGIERGDEFLTDIKWFEENFVKYKDNWGQIQKAARELNAKFAGAYNIEVEMYHKDDEGKEYHIGNIIELDDEITFTFDLPTGMKEEQSGETKKYVLVRIHKNSKGKEEIDTVDYTINDDGTFTTKSDKYSDFVWLEIEEEPTHKHTIVNDEAVEATCTESGLTAGTHCSVCNEVIVAQEPISAKGHTIVTMPGKEATCTEAGLTEGKKCSVCNTVIENQEPISAKGHTIVTMPGKEETCTEAGLTEGKKCSVCNTVTLKQETIPAKGHTIVTVPGKEATCTEAGLTEGKKCSVCNTVTLKQETIPAKGHTIVTVPGKEATCTEAGLTEGKKCSVCNTVTDAQKEIPAKGHDYEGKYKCSICGAINPDYKPDSPVTLEAQGIYGLVADNKHFVCGMVVDSSDKSYVEYGWWACKDDGKTWIKIKDWTLGNEWLDWTPEDYGDYVVVGKARIVGDPSTEVAASTYYFYHPNIKGICQLPYEGEGGGYLIGIESFDDTGADYTYEMLILDCTLLAAGKDAWVYTTGRCKGTDNCLWTIWQPQYGYYWTLFRIYDEKGNLVDEQCYGFQNI